MTLKIRKEYLIYRWCAISMFIFYIKIQFNSLIILIITESASFEWEGGISMTVNYLNESLNSDNQTDLCIAMTIDKQTNSSSWIKLDCNTEFTNFCTIPGKISVTRCSRINPSYAGLNSLFKDYILLDNN